MVQMQNKFYDIAVNKIDDYINNFEDRDFNEIKTLLDEDKFFNYLFYYISSTEENDDKTNMLFEILYENDIFKFRLKDHIPFESKKDKGFYGIPYWSAFRFLEKVIALDYTKYKDVPHKIKKFIDDFIDNGFVDNYHTNVFILKAVSALPILMISDEYFEFFKKALDSRFGADYFGSNIGENIVKKAIDEKDHRLIEKSVDLIFQYNRSDDNPPNIKAKIDDYWLKKILDDYSQQILSVLEIDFIEFLIKLMDKIIDINPMIYKMWYIQSLISQRENNISQYHTILLNTLIDGTQQLIKLGDKEVVENLYHKEQAIFRRVSLYLINKNYDVLNEIFWKKLPPDFSNIDIRQDLFDLVRDHYNKFPESHKKEIKEKIDAISKDKIQIQKRWEDTLNEIDEKKKSEENYITDLELGVPTYSEPIFGYDKPKDLIEQIENMSIDKQVEYLNSIEDKFIEGCRHYYKNYIQDNYKDYLLNLEKFTKAKKPYQHSVLLALLEVWKSGNSFEWEYIFDFLNYLFSDKKIFEVKSEDEEFDYNEWLIDDTLDLLIHGTMRDEHAFDIKYIYTSIEILATIYKQFNEEELIRNDVIIDSYNSTYGKLFSAIVNTNLRLARVNKFEEGNRWIPEFKTIFDSELPREKNSSSHFSGALGRYFINLYWIDKDWIEDNIDIIFPEANLDQWKYTMQSFLFHNSKMYVNIIKLLSDSKNDLIEEAIKLLDDDSSIKRLTQYVISSFIYEIEGLDNRNHWLKLLLEKQNIDYIEYIINYCKHSEFEIDISDKLVELWNKIYTSIKDIETEKRIEILSTLNRLLPKIEDITKLGDMVKESVEYADWNHNIMYVEEALSEQVHDHPDFVGKLIKEIIDSEYNQFYFSKEETFKNIVEVLYEKGEKELSDYICNNLGEKGMYFLKDLWVKYNT